MTAIVFPTGDSLSSTGGEFCFPRRVGLISSMKTVEETRRSRLQMLVDKYNGMANLCGWIQPVKLQLVLIAGGGTTIALTTDDKRQITELHDAIVQAIAAR